MLSNSIDLTEKLATTLDELIDLLRVFVLKVVSTACPAISLQDAPEFNRIMQLLCNEAPHVAQAIAGAIQEQKISPPKTQGPKLREAPYRSKRKRSLVVDSSYRPSKSAKRNVECCPGNADGSDHQPDFDTVQKNTTLHAREQARGNEEPLREGNRIRVVLSAPPNYHNTHQDDSRDGRKAVHWEPISRENINVVSGSYGATSVSNGCVALTPQEIPASSSEGSSQSISVAKTDQTTSGKFRDGSSSPRTEEMQRERIPGTLGIANGASSPASETAFKELILSVVKTIHELCNCPGGPPQAACQSILKSLQEGRSYTSEWSDGAKWMKMLDWGSSQQSKVTVSNMLTYIGFWEWFIHQVKDMQVKVRTKKNKPIGEKGAKTHVLNEMQNGLNDSGPQPAAQEKWFSRVGLVTLEDNASDIPPRDGLTGVIAMAKAQQRSRISTLLHRGKWLSTKLVKQLGRGILLHPKIWDCTKMSEENLDVWIKKTKEDSKQKQLWEILGPQLDHLVMNGSPDLRAFYKDLRRKQLVTEEEINEMRICYHLDSDALPKSTLQLAVERLKGLVSSKVLKKDRLDKTDTIAVDGGLELTCDLFDLLNPGEWLNDSAIYLAMQISDKPPYIRFGLSIPLECEPEKIKETKEIEKVIDDSDCQVVEIRKTTPLVEWAKKIKDDQRTAGEKLVHFRPINRRKHFTLLEVNAREGVIRHYDSRADRGIKETEISRLVKKELGSFGFRYEEAETPQQDDGWSCGIRVIWNFRCLCNGIPIGSWSERLDPEPMLLETVEGMIACVEAGAMRNANRGCAFGFRGPTQ